MAKFTKAFSAKGYLHEDMMIEEIDTKNETSELYDLLAILKEEFVGKTISISIKVENAVESSSERPSEDE